MFVPQVKGFLLMFVLAVPVFIAWYSVVLFFARDLD